MTTMSTTLKSLVGRLGRGGFEHSLVQAVSTLGPKAYGSEIHRELCRTLNRTVSVAQVFNTLDRLREKGFLDADHVSPKPGERGPVRNVYRLSQTGRQAYAELNKSDAPPSGKEESRHEYVKNDAPKSA